MPPKISVIVPIYNSERTLKECVDSILAQTYSDFELILVDDGSKDASSQICDSYASQDSRVISLHKANGGVSSARNKGLSIVRGEWITFIDSDDYITNTYFEQVVGSSKDLVIKDYLRLRDKIYGTEIPKYLFEMTDISELANCYLNSMLLRGPVFKFYRKSLVDGIIFNENMIIGEDTCFVMDYMARAKTFELIEEGYYVVRMAPPAEQKWRISTRYAISSLEYLLESFKKLELIHHTLRSTFLPILNYYKRISKNDWENNPKKWYADLTIKSLYMYVWFSLSFNQKLQIIAIRIKDMIKYKFFPI